MWKLFTCHDNSFSHNQNDYIYISLEFNTKGNTILSEFGLKAHKSKVYL